MLYYRAWVMCVLLVCINAELQCYGHQPTQSGGCQSCPHNMIWVVSGTSSKCVCAGGFYQVEPQVEGLDTCKLCPKGKARDTPTTTATDFVCATCEEGKYAAFVGQTQCTNCPAQRFCNQPGCTACTACGMLEEPTAERTGCEAITASGQCTDGTIPVSPFRSVAFYKMFSDGA